MRPLRSIFNVSLLATVFLLLGATSRAGSIPISGDGWYIADNLFSFSVDGPSFNAYSASPDSSSVLQICGNFSACIPSFGIPAYPGPGYSGGYLNGVNADYLEGGLQFNSSATYNIPPGNSELPNVPVSVYGSVDGFNSLGLGMFGLDIAGTGTADIYISTDWGGTQYTDFSFSGTGTVSYAATPEPSSLLLLVSGMALIGVGRRVSTRSAREIA